MNFPGVFPFSPKNLGVAPLPVRVVNEGLGWEGATPAELLLGALGGSKSTGKAVENTGSK